MRRRMLASVGGKPLPYDAEVEYIEGTGTQWIDTGVLANDRTVARIRFIATEYTSSVFFGNYLGNGHLFNFFIRGNNWSYFQLKSSTIQTTSFGSLNMVLNVELGNNYIKDLDTDTEVISGASQSGLVSDATLKWFYYDRSSIVSGKGKIYSTVILDGADLIRNLVPVRFTNENGVSEGALYDRVSGQIFRNAGTGAFVIGPDKA